MPQVHSTHLKRKRYSRVNGGRSSRGTPMRQLPKRWTATAQKPCSKRLPSWVRRSSRSRRKKPMSAGFSLRSPRGSGGASRGGWRELMAASQGWVGEEVEADEVPQVVGRVEVRLALQAATGPPQ